MCAQCGVSRRELREPQEPSRPPGLSRPSPDYHYTHLGGSGISGFHARRIGHDATSRTAADHRSETHGTGRGSASVRSSEGETGPGPSQGREFSPGGTRRQRFEPQNRAKYMRHADEMSLQIGHPRTDVINHPGTALEAHPLQALFDTPVSSDHADPIRRQTGRRGHRPPPIRLFAHERCHVAPPHSSAAVARRGFETSMNGRDPRRRAGPGPDQRRRRRNEELSRIVSFNLPHSH
jgi:hypothetical protein